MELKQALIIDIQQLQDPISYNLLMAVLENCHNGDIKEIFPEDWPIEADDYLLPRYQKLWEGRETSTLPASVVDAIKHFLQQLREAGWDEKKHLYVKIWW